MIGLCQQRSKVKCMYSAFSIYQKKDWKRSTMITKLKAKYEWCFSMLICKKIPLKQLQVKLEKTKEVTYLEANKPQTGNHMHEERKKKLEKSSKTGQKYSQS